MGTLRFATKIVAFHNVEICFITVYLWCSEKLSERNNTILKQIHLLKVLLNLPILCFGDFNITFQQFEDSGWVKRLNVKLIDPGVDSTISTNSDRKIDFGFISTEIEAVFNQVFPVIGGEHVFGFWQFSS